MVDFPGVLVSQCSNCGHIYVVAVRLGNITSIHIMLLSLGNVKSVNMHTRRQKKLMIILIL